MSTEEEKIAAHYDSVAAEYHLQYDPDMVRQSPVYPANFIRLQILERRVGELKPARLYEVGVGEGTPLVRFAALGAEVAGCDVAKEMVSAAKRNLVSHDLDPEVVRWADIEAPETLAPQLGGGQYDVLVASGVLPHLSSDDVMIEAVRRLVRPGGTALIEFRNKIFSLFTFNRHTRDFIVEDLLAGVDESVRSTVAAQLETVVAVDQPPPREESPPGAGVAGFDSIRAKFHNPFELIETFEANGLRDAHVHWYHYHPAPPMFETAVGADRFRDEALGLETPTPDWRGMFLCSAGVLEVRVAP